MYDFKLINATNITIVDNEDGTKKLSCSVPIVDDYGNVSSIIVNVSKMDMDGNMLNALADDDNIIYTLEI